MFRVVVSSRSLLLTSAAPRLPTPSVFLAAALICVGSWISVESVTAQSSAPVLSSNPERLCTELEVVDGLVVFEGDIILGSCKRDARGRWTFEPRGAFAELATGLVSSKAGATPSSWFWPGGVVPYVISASFSEANDPAVFANIQSAIRHWEGRSTVRLVPRTNETAYVEFVPSSGCASFLGRVSGRQEIWLVAGGACGFGSTVHEIGHALGFYHEQSRQDRDTFVTINFANIEPDRVGNFNKYNSGSDLNAYDYGSIMHYGSNFFSIDPKNLTTIDIVQAQYNQWAAIYGNIGIGQRLGLSVLDRQAADEMYNVCWNGASAGSPYWQANEWRACSASCASPGRTREVFCHDTNGFCVADGNCPAGSRPNDTESCADLLSCDFDTGSCGWDPVDAGDHFEWTAHFGPTRSPDTGPSADHTSGSGSYLYTEASTPRISGDTAFLSSSPVNIPAGSELTFWYHYFGVSLGTLEVQVVPCGGGEQTVLTISPGNPVSQDAWREAMVVLPAATNARIRFKVTRGSGFSGDIAIDDISFASTAIFSDGFESGNTTRWSSSVP